MIRKINYYGNPFIGLFIYTDDRHTFVPKNMPDRYIDSMIDLETEVIKTNIAGCELLGVYVEGNSKGVILPYQTTEAESAVFKDLGYDCYILNDKHNAIGNNLAVNDKGGIINPNINRKEIKKLEEVLGVELIPMKILNYDAVGTLCVVTNKGFIVHNDVDEETIRKLKQIFKVDGINATVNMGSPLVSLGVIANDKGCILGSETTGFEVQRISEGLGLL